MPSSAVPIGKGRPDSVVTGNDGDDDDAGEEPDDDSGVIGPENITGVDNPRLNASPPPALSGR